jgi:hypothetical protein
VLPLRSHPQTQKSFRTLSLALLLLFPLLARAQAEKPVLGRLVGEDLIVLGSAGETFVGAGDTRTVTSGSEVRVRSGEARLELAGGGLVRICGPAHFTLLGSGGQLTLALDSGRVEVLPSGSTRLAVYTVQIVARPVEIAGEPVEFMLGVEAEGAICIRAAAGAVELEEQLTGKKLIVPQGGEVLLPGGRLAGIREAPGGCRCGLELAERAAQPRPGGPEPAAQPRAPEAAAPVARASAQPPAAGEALGRPAAPAQQAELLPPSAPPAGRSPSSPGLRTPGPPAGPGPPERATPPALAGAPPEVSPPVWKVMMPPLVFNAREPSPLPQPGPEIVLLVREARVQSALVIRGEVVPRTPQKKHGFWSKLGGFFGHLFGRHPQSRA